MSKPIVIRENSVIIEGEYDNDITIGVQYDGNGDYGKKRLCILLNLDGELSVFEPTTDGLTIALQQMATADAEERQFTWRRL